MTKRKLAEESIPLQLCNFTRNAQNFVVLLMNILPELQYSLKPRTPEPDKYLWIKTQCNKASIRNCTSKQYLKPQGLQILKS